MSIPPEITRTASVKWEGDVAKGHGTISTGSGKISATYSFGTRFSGDPGTNPEELLGASHAACFTMALSAGLTRAGHPPASIETTATVHLHSAGAVIDVSKIELVTNAVVAGLTADEFAQLAADAKKNCPVSKALAAVPISLQATLEPA
jgi:osmotically inducible protein OsmC